MSCKSGQVSRVSPLGMPLVSTFQSIE